MAIDILLVEDSPDDAELIALALRRAKLAFSIERVETEPAFVAALDRRRPDVVLCDFHLPRFSARRALEIAGERGLSTPFLVVSRHITKEEWAEMRRLGARECVAKDRLDRLAPTLILLLGPGHRS